MTTVNTPTVTAVETPTVNDVATPAIIDTTDATTTAVATQAATTATQTAADDTAVTGYTPTFGATTRTVVYVVCAILGILGLLAAVAALTTNAPAWLTLASSALAFVAPYVANVFGVAYNPLKMAGK